MTNGLLINVYKLRIHKILRICIQKLRFYMKFIIFLH